MFSGLLRKKSGGFTGRQNFTVSISEGRGDERTSTIAMGT